MSNIKSNAIIVLRVIVFMTLLLSSILKAVNIQSFSSEVKLYSDIYLPEWLYIFPRQAAVFVCMLEMMIALMGLKRLYWKVTNVICLLLMSFFLYLTGVNYFNPSLIGSVESCGCFGEFIHMTPLQSFVKSLVLWLITLILTLIDAKHNGHINIRKIIVDSYFYICVVISLALPFYSVQLLDVLERTTYIVGYIILCFILVCIVGYIRGYRKYE